MMKPRLSRFHLKPWSLRDWICEAAMTFIKWAVPGIKDCNNIDEDKKKDLHLWHGKSCSWSWSCPCHNLSWLLQQSWQSSSLRLGTGVWSLWIWSIKSCQTITAISHPLSAPCPWSSASWSWSHCWRWDWQSFRSWRQWANRVGIESSRPPVFCLEHHL